MTGCETGAAAEGGAVLGGEGGVCLDFESTDGGVKVVEGGGGAMHGGSACESDFGFWGW